MPDHWTTHAACRDTPKSVFFVERGHTEDASTARAICATCPVRSSCIDFAIANDMRFGIWGGLNYTELRAERRRRGMFRVNYRANQAHARQLGLP